ncbi:MAG TPA: hypothetical protein VGM65_11435 [Candidatus Udaeobacter sp.]|jgi:hypothetical protein
MRIKVATSKPSKNVILIPQSREKNLGSVAPDRRYKPEMFRFAQFATGRIRRGGHDNPIEEMSSNDAS